MKKGKLFLILMVLVFTASNLFASGANAGSSAGSTSPTTISIFMPNGGRTYKDDLPNIQEIMKRTNTVLDIVSATGNIAEATNLLFASNDLPDIVAFNGLDFQQYIGTGYLMPLNDLLKSHGQNILNHTAEDAWNFVTIQGKIYAFPRQGNINRTFTYVRADWLRNLGIDISVKPNYGEFGGKVVTLNEFKDILIQFTKNDPDKNGINDTYGLGATGQKTNFGWANIYGTFGGIPGHYYITDNKAVPWDTTDQYREGLRFINSLWTEGLIDPEIYLNNNDQARQKIRNSVSGAGTGEGWSMAYEQQINGLQALVPDADFIPLWLTGNDGKFSGTPYTGSIGYTMTVTTMSEHPEKAMDFLNYLSSDEGWHLLRVGMEGTDYNMVDGFPIMTESGNVLYQTMTLDSLWPLANRLDLVHRLAMRPVTEWAQQLRQKWEILYMSQTDKLYTSAFYGLPNPREFNEFGVDVNNWIEQSSMAFITGETPLNDSNWNTYISTWKRMGGVKILQGFVNSYNSLRGTNVTAGITE